MSGFEREAENARLVAIRAALIEEDATIAAAEARRVTLLSEACEIARVRTARQTSGNSREREMELRSIAAELGAAVRMNDRTMQRRMGDAEQLTRLFPATVQHLADGRISARHADAVLEAGVRLDDDTIRTAFEATVLKKAVTDTAARTRAYAQRLAETVDPRPLQERFDAANESRCVTVRELENGMAELCMLLPVTLAFGILDRLTRQAKAIKNADRTARREHAERLAAARAGANAAAAAAAAGDDTGERAAPDAASAGIDGSASSSASTDAPTEGDEPVWFDERTRDQVRADLAIDMLLTGTPGIDLPDDRSAGGLGAIRAQVQISIPVTTLTGTTDAGCELDGKAPVDPETARRLAGDARIWDRVMTDPVRGTVLDVDRYEPAASQRRFLAPRDIHCRALGCRRPVRDGQIDHNTEWHEGGRTHLWNLAIFCVGHHTMKTETEWVVKQLPGGTLEWTSPLGFTYRDDPPTRIVFLPDGPPRRGEHPPF